MASTRIVDLEHVPIGANIDAAVAERHAGHSNPSILHKIETVLRAYTNTYTQLILIWLERVSCVKESMS